MYCVFTTAIFYFLFGEQLQQKFVIGIMFMITCVIFEANPPEKETSVIGFNTQGSDLKFFYTALGLGLLAPLFISFFISVSRFWTTNYGYKSTDFTIDTFMLMGIIEIYFVFEFQAT